MTLISGKIGNSIVGSDHVGWVTKYSLFSVNIINQTLLTALLTGTPLKPIARIYVEEVATGIETEIPGVVTNCTIRNNKDFGRGTFSFTVKPKKLGSQFSNLFLTELDTNYFYYIKIKAGYIINGQEILVQVMKGHTLDRLPSFGGNSSSIVINGVDFAEKLQRADGVFSGFTTALPLVIKILNVSGFNQINYVDFTDFSLPSGFVFNNNSALEVIARLADYSSFTYYFDGAGIFTIKDLNNSQSPTVDYNYPTSSIFVYKPDRSQRNIFTKVNVIGDGVSITRQTDSADQAKFGGNRFTAVQNSLITTSAEAETVADIKINDSRKDKGFINVSFNPYIYIGTILSTSHQEIGGVTRSYRVNGFTSTYQAETLTFKSYISAERTDFIVPVIGTIV